uniref:FLYWCH-type domain-containing protein n=1 Tax=Ditylenchus dipsaci TaxID=166011 RepID=A0A915DNB2_9BILA
MELTGPIILLKPPTIASRPNSTCASWTLQLRELPQHGAARTGRRREDGEPVANVEPVTNEEPVAIVEPPVIILSEKEKAMLTHEGHLFWKHMNSKAGDKTIWGCIKRKTTGCLFRIHTRIATGEVIKTMGVHNHGKSATEIPLRTIKAAIKTQAKGPCIIQRNIQSNSWWSAASRPS